jgi:hypothetical protein
MPRWRSASPSTSPPIPAPTIAMCNWSYPLDVTLAAFPEGTGIQWSLNAPDDRPSTRIFRRQVFALAAEVSKPRVRVPGRGVRPRAMARVLDPIAQHQEGFERLRHRISTLDSQVAVVTPRHCGDRCSAAALPAVSPILDLERPARHQTAIQVRDCALPQPSALVRPTLRRCRARLPPPPADGRGRLLRWRCLWDPSEPQFLRVVLLLFPFRFCQSLPANFERDRGVRAGSPVFLTRSPVSMTPRSPLLGLISARVG